MTEVSKKIIEEGISQNHSLLSNVFTKRERYGISEEYSLIWDQRVVKLQENNNIPPKALVLAWKILLAETIRITETRED